MTHAIHITLLSLLIGCTQMTPTPRAAPSEAARPLPSHSEAQVNELFTEASQLADQVKTGTLSRTEAAEKLNSYRLQRIGHNPTDDRVFAIYHTLAIERDAGRITQHDAQTQMEQTLRHSAQRWAQQRKRSAEPIFTNFLMKLYRLPLLGH